MTALAGLFVVGTDTGVGKTRVATAIARALCRAGHRVGVLKPVATGATRIGDSWDCSDASLLSEAIGNAVPLERVTPLLFEEPLAPVVAARRLGTPLNHEDLLSAVQEGLAWWSGRADVMVIEGIGGFLCPLAEGTTVADLALMLDYPLIIVARRGLGTLNHTLLTVEAARSRALRIAGIVLNGPEAPKNPIAEATNASELARRLEGVAILAELDYQADGSMVSTDFDSLDWYGRAKAPRVVGPSAA